MKSAIRLPVLSCAAAFSLYACTQPSPERAPTSVSASPSGLTIENAKTAPGSPPPGMVWIPGGEFSMGAAESADMNMVGMQATGDSRPIHRVYVDGFWMDATEVTNEQFAKFVEATRYVTIAERDLKPEEFPGVPLKDLVPGSAVFTPPSHAVPLNNAMQWWAFVDGADWRHPTGPTSNLIGREQWPVVHIAFDDAVAYAKWAGKRIPTEAEWEFAARGGLSGKLYPWGDAFDSKRLNSYENGIRETTPAGKYSSDHDSPYGIADMCGNVWEWCADWYAEDEYARRAKARVIDPLGPEAGTTKVLRGGAFDFNKSAVRCAYRAANSPFARAALP